jgi:cell division protein FtsI/penicillin-binding protein 2
MFRRLNFVYLFFLIFIVILSVKLFDWQVIKGEDLARQAKNQYTVGKVVSAPRGSILASDGSILSGRRESWLLWASLPSLKENPTNVAKELAPILLEDEVNIENILSRSGIIWVPIKHKVATEVKNNIEALGIPGLGFDLEEDRYYPEASAAAHLLGFVGKDSDGGNIGYFGLEGYYNLSLSGKSGYTSADNDAQGLPILLGSFKNTSALEGVDLVTNIDKAVQLILEKRLKEGVEKYGASGGTVIVADPKTGAILGMSAYPAFEPSKYFDYGDTYFKNPTISDTFEPGSVFKVIVMASALDAGVVTPETICDNCTGPLKVDKYLIETWDRKYHPDSTMTEVIVYSDNVGMAFVGQKLGADAFYDYLDKFGIGKTTGIDLQGEVSIPLRAKGSWNIVDLATASFGQGVAVTGIEMVRAVSAIANEGKLPTPEVVNFLKGKTWQEKIKPKIVQIISSQAASEMTAMMVAAAKNGESKWTNTKGFSVAGKTGTAQIPIAGHYDAKNTIASFIGFSPAQNPKFIMLVTLNKPSSSQWASETAAPLWYSIAKDLFPYFSIQPEN